MSLEINPNLYLAQQNAMWANGKNKVGGSNPKPVEFGVEQGGIPATTGFQAKATEFDWRSLNKFDTTLGQVQAPNPNVDAQAINPFANVQPVTQVAPAQQIAKNAENQQLQQGLARIGTGELSPKSDAKFQIWA